MNDFTFQRKVLIEFYDIKLNLQNVLSPAIHEERFFTAQYGKGRHVRM